MFDVIIAGGGPTGMMLASELRLQGVKVVGLEQDDDGVTVHVGNGTATPLRARFVVGCDGGRSTVRKLLGVGFPGEPSRIDTLLGEMEVTASPEDINEVMTEVRKTEKRF